MILTRRDLLKTIAGALILPALSPKILFADARRIPVLLYHDISDRALDGYSVSPSAFAAQMERLYSYDYRAVSLRDLNDLPKERAGKVVVITFDGGYASFMEYAFPLFEDCGFRATLNIVGRYVGAFMPVGGNRPMLSWDEYRFLNESGLVDLGCNTHNLHVRPGVVQYSERTIEDDLHLFVDVFTREIGRKPDILAWPFGAYSRDSMKIAEKLGFRYLQTSREALFAEGGSLNEIPRLNISDKLDLVSFEQYIGEA
jgi:peptidoglycan/xylan/chitin deacetylase (PgdA/CDA1 family)